MAESGLKQSLAKGSYNSTAGSNPVLSFSIIFIKQVLMKIYLVGGAVRDKLLGLPVTDRDWVVVGTTAQTMKSQGYISVLAKQFPIFLHPITHEEYALARKEYKSGHGYMGFKCYFEPTVTLEEDLFRRDFTINSIAQDIEGNYIDPYHGIKDIKAKIIRHTSINFAQDPLRILRGARLYAKLAPLGFTIHPDTLELMRSIVDELVYISKERLGMEIHKIHSYSTAELFFQTLEQVGALDIILTMLKGKHFPTGNPNYYIYLANLVLPLDISMRTKLLKEIRVSNHIKSLVMQVCTWLDLVSIQDQDLFIRHLLQSGLPLKHEAQWNKLYLVLCEYTKSNLQAWQDLISIIKDIDLSASLCPKTIYNLAVEQAVKKLWVELRITSARK